MHFAATTLLRVSAEGIGTALVLLVQARTGQAASSGFLLAAVLLPYVVSGPVLGNAMDRVRRTRLFATLLAAGYAIAVALLLLTAGDAPLWLAILAAIAVGCTEPIVVALSSLLPRIVSPTRLTRAYGLESASYNLAGIAGPGLVAGTALDLRVSCSPTRATGNGPAPRPTNRAPRRPEPKRAVHPREKEP